MNLGNEVGENTAERQERPSNPDGKKSINDKLHDLTLTVLYGIFFIVLVIHGFSFIWEVIRTVFGW